MTGEKGPRRLRPLRDMPGIGATLSRRAHLARAARQAAAGPSAEAPGAVGGGDTLRQALSTLFQDILDLVASGRTGTVSRSGRLTPADRSRAGEVTYRVDVHVGTILTDTEDKR